MEELMAVCPGAREHVEAGIKYIHLPALKLPGNLGVMEALLCPQQHGGYTTRLFLTSAIPSKGANWTSHTILGRTWYTWSWNNVPANMRPVEILLEHLRALR